MIELHLSFLHSNSFLRSLEELASCHQDIPCGQSNVSKCLAYSHTLKINCKGND